MRNYLPTWHSDDGRAFAAFFFSYGGRRQSPTDLDPCLGSAACWLVRETLSSMPLGTTEQWSKTQLDDETRSRLRSIRSMKEWYKLLSEKFSTNIGDAVRDFQALQYTLWDVYERHDPADFLQNVVILGQESNIAPTSNTQAVSAYNKLHVSLQLWLTKPNQDTTMTSFMRQVDDVKGQWYKTQIGMSPSSTQP
ncbi:hypothetical protein N7535_003448 [Penicillium sp. DV-2018c]|nr:hypothetical protein N7535_003448 [Penicillium sp. DV-2018c]